MTYESAPSLLTDDRTWFFLFIFGLLSLQMFLSYIQIRRYQTAVKSLSGKGVLGIGQRRGGIRPGEILILAYERERNRVSKVLSMKGFSIFAAFREIPEYEGLGLDEIRRAGIERDSSEMRAYRKKHPYDPNTLSKKKGALIQAVEAIDLRFSRELALNAKNSDAKEE
ncbi:MAG: transcriptional regulator GutM [Synergistaceae bacterium]|nr:transcriptional regulator GutM [Synergistaceae bacterium]